MSDPLAMETDLAVAEIFDTENPLERVYVLARAIEQVMNDLADDEAVDASEGLTPREIENVRAHAQKIGDALNVMYARCARRRK